MIPDLKPYVQTPEQLYTSWVKFNLDVFRLIFNAKWQLGQDIYNAWADTYFPAGKK